MSKPWIAKFYRILSLQPNIHFVLSSFSFAEYDKREFYVYSKKKLGQIQVCDITRIWKLRVLTSLVFQTYELASLPA